MSKKANLALLMIVLIGMFAFTATLVSAATASIAITLVQDDNLTPVEGITSGCISVKNSAGETLDMGIDYTLLINQKVVTISNLPYADTYYVSFAKGGATATAVVTPTLSATPKTAILKWSSSDAYRATKSGVIAGLTVDGSGNPLPGVTVKAFNTTTIYETTSAPVTGAYKLFVPAGTYTLVVVGKDTGTDYANISQPIKVVAGQAVGPMIDKNGQTPWSSMGYNSNMGLTDLTINGSLKNVTGTAYKGMTVSVFAYDPAANPVTNQHVAYKRLGLTKVNAKSPATSGAFSITLSEYPAGKNLLVRVVDTNFNAYEDTTYMSSAVSKMTATLKADTAATIITPITIAETEPTGIAIGNFNRNITSVVVTDGGSSITLTPSQYSTATSGKLIINKGVLTTAKEYTITISAKGYNDASVTQIVGPSTTMPPTTLTGTFTVKAGGGTVSGSAQFSAIGTAGAGNSLVYVVSTQSVIQVKLGNPLNGYTALAANTDITGVNATTAKYIHVYEISATGAVAKAKVFALTAAQIKTAPVIPVGYDTVTLKSETAKVKGKAVTSLGTPSSTLSGIVAGSATITVMGAADTTGNPAYYSTVFEAATVSENISAVAVKYASGASTANFANDSLTNFYSNEAISAGDFFIIKVEDFDKHVAFYYRINVTIAPVTGDPDASSTDIFSGQIYSGQTVLKGIHVKLLDFDTKETIATMITDTDGMYYFKVHTNTSYQLEVGPANDYKLQSPTIMLKWDSTKLNINLGYKGYSVSGKITNSLGAGIAGAVVSLADPDTGDGIGDMLVTASDGTYTVPYVQDGSTVKIRATNSGDLNNGPWTYTDPFTMSGAAVAGKDIQLPS